MYCTAVRVKSLQSILDVWPGCGLCNTGSESQVQVVSWQNNVAPGSVIKSQLGKKTLRSSLKAGQFFLSNCRELII